MAGSGKKTSKRPVRITVVDAREPARLTKLARMKDGKLTFEPGGNLIYGLAGIERIDDHQQFISLLEELGCNHALIYGIPGEELVSLTTKDIWPLRTIADAHHNSGYDRDADGAAVC